MKLIDLIPFLVAVLIGLFFMVLGVSSFFNETPLSSAFNTLIFGVLWICGALYYRHWIRAKIREESDSTEE